MQTTDENKLSSTTMNACLFYGPEDIRYETIQTPEISENEILVKVNTALTCGTDLKTFERGHPVLIKKTPSTFGHQFSGDIVDIGKNVEKFKIGQKVISLNTSPCFQCKFCKEEKFSLCENLFFLNGAYAEYIAIPEQITLNNTYEIPSGVSYEIAALTESIAVVLHGIKRSNITKDKTVCIIGTGGIGLLFNILSKHIGAKVISIGRNKNKLDFAKELGADYTFVNDENLIPNLKNATNGYGPDIVIEASGIPEVWELAFEIVGKGGLVNFFGGCKKGSKVNLDTYKLHYEEITIVGVFHHTPFFVREALSLLSDNVLKEKFSKLITQTLPLKDLKNAFLLQKSGKAIQVAVKPWN